MKLKEIIKKIDLLQSQIDSFGSLDIELLNRIQYKFRLDWNYYSNAMEGNSLSLNETKQLMMDNVTIDGKPFKDIAEMRGHDTEVLEIFKMGKGEVRISEKRIKNMHKTIMHEDDESKRKHIGEWKTMDNYILNYRGEKTQFLPFADVPDAVHRLLNSTNSEIDAFYRGKLEKHPVLIAFEFHLRYLEIHPFYDGNGRSGRLLMNLLLISLGYPPVILSEKSRQNYYKLLAEVQGYGADPNDFYSFLGELLSYSQQLVLDAIAGKEILEVDDIDKEVALWKSSLESHESSLIEKSDEIIMEVYQKSIRPLFELFLKKHEQFDDLFLKTDEYNSIDNNTKSSIKLDFFESWLEFKRTQIEIIKKESVNLSIDTELTQLHQMYHFSNVFEIMNIREFQLQIRFFGFKKNGNNPFDDYSRITIKFDQYKYGILTEPGSISKSSEKLYSQSYSNKEMNEIVNEKVKEFLSNLQSRVDLKNN